MTAPVSYPACPEPGVYREIPMDVYHRWPYASNSRLSRLRRSPAHLQAYLAEPPEERSALVIGRAVHTTILEPEHFESMYVVAETCTALKKGDGKPCTNDGTYLHRTLGWRCGIHLKGETPDFVLDKFVLPSADFATCRGMRKAVFAHSSARGLLTGPGDIELSIVWDDPATGVRCKARLDRLSPSTAGGAIADLKSTPDASLSEFQRSIYKWGYHRQAAFYLDGCAAVGIEANHFVFVPVEKTAPYAVAAYRLIEGAIDAGRDQLRQLLALYQQCTERNEWPAYPDEVRDIALPSYAWSQIDEEVAA